MIAVMMTTSPAEDVFEMADVARSAEATIECCVTESHHLGGDVLVGGREMFEVAVVRRRIFEEGVVQLAKRV